MSQWAFIYWQFHNALKNIKSQDVINMSSSQGSVNNHRYWSVLSSHDQGKVARSPLYGISLESCRAFQLESFRLVPLEESSFEPKSVNVQYSGLLWTIKKSCRQNILIFRNVCCVFCLLHKTFIRLKWWQTILQYFLFNFSTIGRREGCNSSPLHTWISEQISRIRDNVWDATLFSQ